MKIGDRVYLITDQLQTGAGIPGIICALRDDSAVEVAVDFTHGTKILKVRNWDILPSNLYTHSILNVVYQTHEKIEHKYGSILNFTIEEIVAQLIQQGLAPQTARRCADLFDEVEWHNARLPLRQWLGSIRDFYLKKPWFREEREQQRCHQPQGRSQFQAATAVSITNRSVMSRRNLP